MGFDIITSGPALAGMFATLSASVITILKYRQEQKKSSDEIKDLIRTALNDIAGVKNDVQGLQIQNNMQEQSISMIRKSTQVQLRNKLYDMLYLAVNRNYTSAEEKIEINSMFTVYVENGGNGEIETLYHIYENLEVRSKIEN